MKSNRTHLLLLVAVLAMPAAVTAKDENSSANLVVASNKSPEDLRRDVWRAEKDFYSLYNKLNDESLYDVRCAHEAPTGSVIKEQVCRPKFLSRAIKEGKVRSAADLTGDTAIGRKMTTYRENISSLVAANPELQAAVATLNKAHDELAASKKD